ncbi:hypothetical protein PFTANZ_05897 [Plasmodium falciparum Tanzania (2000708)]|uniref:Surface antigen n=1 Tax=Plasmodium falciparum Tanzania (2000708) TaxID=1036725 RepID=A0A024VZT9_PLAFA|nr:hypothetical protein PFTANZ_05897 [Plasmodium falciparum Tanzania (2000708)]
MKVLYINILLFALPLNILVTLSHVVYPKNTYITQHTPTTTSRLLCECELYSLANYDSDPEMKRIMQQFEDRTSKRFHEYDERMKTTRQKCKEQCDKEIQKIVLKDKLEKQMAEQLTTLDTNITTEDIPTCICEKSLADKMEKNCLRCGYGLGSVAPTVGLIGSVAVNVWKPKALESAITAALKAGASNISAASLKAGNAKGMEIVLLGLGKYNVDKLCPDLFQSIGTTTRYNEASTIIKLILDQHNLKCGLSQLPANETMCADIGSKFNILSKPGGNFFTTREGITKAVNGIVAKAEQSAKAVADAENAKLTAAIKARETALIEGRFESSITSINASIIAIIVIVLIMVIIYLILRYRRKKKMKKKLQYIKLLEE